MGGLRGEEKWRPDRIGTPEAGEIRRGRWERPSGRSRTEAKGDCPTHSGLGSLLSSQAGPLPPKASTSPRPHWSWGHKREVGEIRRGRQEGPSRPEKQERRRGHLPRPLEPRKPAGLPGEVPHSLRLGPKPHSPTAPRAYSSPVGPKHRCCPPPKPHPCLGLTLHSQGLYPPFFFFFLSFFFSFSLLFFMIVVLMYLPVVDSSIF